MHERTRRALSTLTHSLTPCRIQLYCVSSRLTNGLDRVGWPAGVCVSRAVRDDVWTPGGGRAALVQYSIIAFRKTADTRESWARCEERTRTRTPLASTRMRLAPRRTQLFRATATTQIERAVMGYHL